MTYRSEQNPFDLMQIAEEIDSFGSLSTLAKQAGVEHKMLSSPPKIEGLKQQQSGNQMPPAIFQCSYGL